ncbi:hypothetical protein BJ508DRAFT_363776 [Ascobolus immersus RN42]|uniref:Uncharacterized protein n=1 Tax=Ascobolus immersus RN42 TaxID=1160509 RepID=A0A3N4I326_ASCIM|nr:hypothetical protein BJ508DRAFT_363776 [Ascobolus immersus RN42]
MLSRAFRLLRRAARRASKQAKQAFVTYKTALLQQVKQNLTNAKDEVIRELQGRFNKNHGSKVQFWKSLPPALQKGVVIVTAPALAFWTIKAVVDFSGFVASLPVVLQEPMVMAALFAVSVIVLHGLFGLPSSA